MTKIAKILVVFVAMASLTFLGFAITATVGGPNWEDQIPTLVNYKITLGETRRIRSGRRSPSATSRSTAARTRSWRRSSSPASKIRTGGMRRS